MSTIKIKSCGREVPNCGKDQIPIGSSCASYKRKIDDNCVTYEVQDQDVSNVPIGETQTLGTPYECMYSCAKINDCKAVRYDFNTTQCQLLGSDIQSSTISSGAGAGVTNGDEEHCYTVYKKRAPRDNTNLNCFNIIAPQNSDEPILSIDMSDLTPKDKIVKIKGDYIGAGCRDFIANKQIDTTTSDATPVLRAMGEWCGKHSNISTCRAFCNNPSYKEFCPQPSAQKTYLFVGLTLGALFLYILLFISLKQHRGLVSIIFIPLIVIGGILAGMELVRVTAKNPYQGETPDNSPESVPKFQPNCLNLRCSCNRITGVCDHKPDGEYNDLVSCESNCCIVDDYIPYGGHCYRRGPNPYVKNRGGCSSYRSGTVSCWGNPTTAGNNWGTCCYHGDSATCHGRYYDNLKSNKGLIPKDYYYCNFDMQWEKCNKDGGCNVPFAIGDPYPNAKPKYKDWAPNCYYSNKGRQWYFDSDGETPALLYCPFPPLNDGNVKENLFSRSYVSARKYLKLNDYLICPSRDGFGKLDFTPTGITVSYYEGGSVTYDSKNNITGIDTVGQRYTTWTAKFSVSDPAYLTVDGDGSLAVYLGDPDDNKSRNTSPVWKEPANATYYYVDGRGSLFALNGKFATLKNYTSSHLSF